MKFLKLILLFLLVIIFANVKLNAQIEIPPELLKIIMSDNESIIDSDTASVASEYTLLSCPNISPLYKEIFDVYGRKQCHA